MYRIYDLKQAKIMPKHEKLTFLI